MKRLLLLVLLALPAFAQEDLINADRPGIADGSQTIAPHTFQFESAFERDDAVKSTPTLLRYGVTQSFELRVEGQGHQSGGGMSGWAPASIGFKYHFLDKPSLGVIARAFQHGTEDVRLAADYDLSEKWSINPNAGIEIDKHASTGTAALTVQYNVSKTLNVFVDGGAQRSYLLLDLGTAWIIGRDTQLDLSLGRGVHGAAPKTFFAAGLSRRF
jgi:hypothetical protein